MASNKLKGLLTENDRRQFLRDIYEETVLSNTQKKIDSFSREEFYGGICPYCHTMNLFVNQGRWKYGDKEFVLAKCDGAPPDLTGCGRNALVKVKVLQEGDILMGLKFTPVYTFFTVEEIEQKYGHGTTETDEELKEKHERWEKQRRKETEQDRKLKKDNGTQQLHGYLLR
jgi:hypothetical protein